MTDVKYYSIPLLNKEFSRNKVELSLRDSNKTIKSYNVFIHSDSVHVKFKRKKELDVLLSNVNSFKVRRESTAEAGVVILTMLISLFLPADDSVERLINWSYGILIGGILDYLGQDKGSELIVENNTSSNITNSKINEN